MSRGLEIAANALNAFSIYLAARNSVHTWWTGIFGCLLFAAVFFGAKLYAEVTLQVFFIITSAVGWWNWLHGHGGAELPVRSTPLPIIMGLFVIGMIAAAGYGALLKLYTDAYAPILDSGVLAFSVIGQLLLVKRRYETWWCWLIVNSIAVPLYLSRELFLTAVLYAAFWVNAVVALIRWRRLMQT